MSRPRTIALSVSTLAAAAALAACSSSVDPAAGTSSTSGATSTPPSTAPTTATTTTTVAASSSSDSPGGSSGTGRCAESQLRASARAEQVAGVSRHVVRLTFLNKSDRSCTLTGYPGAAIADSSGKQIQQAKRVTGGPVGGTVERSATITVKAGSSVFAWLEGASTKEVGAAQAGCDGSSYPRILVTPPNTTIAVPFTIGWPKCYAFDVHPVRSQ